MFQFTQATSQTTAYFSQGMCLCQLAEQHGNELVPGTEPFAVSFCLVLVDDAGEFASMEKS